MAKQILLLILIFVTCSLVLIFCSYFWRRRKRDNNNNNRRGNVGEMSLRRNKFTDPDLQEAGGSSSPGAVPLIRGVKRKHHETVFDACCSVEVEPQRPLYAPRLLASGSRPQYSNHPALEQRRSTSFSGASSNRRDEQQVISFISDEFENLAKLHKTYTSNPDVASTSAAGPLNLFDCDRVVPKDRLTNYPFPEVALGPRMTSAPDLHINHSAAAPLATSDFEEDNPQDAMLSDVFTGQSLESLNGNVLLSSTINDSFLNSSIAAEIRNFNRSNNNVTQPSTAYHRLSVPNSAAGFDKNRPSNLLEDRNGNDCWYDHKRKETTFDVFQSNASLVSSLLSQNVNGRDEKIEITKLSVLPPYASLPPPTYFEAVLNEHIDKQREIISRRKKSAI